jgi:hypothetical protein
VRPRGRSRPSSSASRRPRPELAALALLVAFSCATARLPAPGVAEKARAASSWSGSLRVSVRGQDLRGRSHALVAFRRPDAMRIEIPGPSGARLIAVARAGRLTAVLPADKARLESAAGPGDFEALLGVALSPGELMDVLLGVAPEAARRYEAEWGASLPRRVRAELSDGTRLDARVDEAEADIELPAAAFDPPPCNACRPIDAAEARRLLGGR